MPHNTDQKDLAEKSYWDSVYNNAASEQNPGWIPTSYDELALEHMLTIEIDRFRPESILEVGCGNSVWLPYLAKKRGLRVFGLDYSEEGCELAKRNLKVDCVEGTIFCKDILQGTFEEIGQYDMVFTLGVVEHFTDLETVLSILLRLVKPGGLLLTEVPNIPSVHGILLWMYQPKILTMHKFVTKKKLIDTYKNLGIKNIRSHYLGVFSIILALGYGQRFPSADKIVLPVVRKVLQMNEKLMRKFNNFKGNRIFSPFIYIVGNRNT